MHKNGNGIDKKKPSIYRIKTFAALKNPVFRLYYCAMLANRATLNMQMVTRARIAGWKGFFRDSQGNVVRTDIKKVI